MSRQNIKLVTSDAWRKSLEGGASPDNLAIGFKSDGCGVDRVSDDEIKALLKDLTEEERALIKAAGGNPDSPERMLPWTISTEQRDRDHDRIMVDGWDLRNYRKNPVVLFGHDYRSLPIGKSVRVWKDMEGHPRLRALALFTPKELGGGFGFAVYELAKGGFLPASSVGFKPGKYEKDADDDAGRGLIFSKGHELLEWSAVPVPSNPGALQEARGLGIDLNPYATELEKLLDGEESAIWLPKADAERFLKAARPESTSVTVTDPVEPEPTAKSDDPSTEVEGLDDAEAAKRLMALLAKSPGIITHLEAGLTEAEPEAKSEPANPRGRDPFAGTEHADPSTEPSRAGAKQGSEDEGEAVDVIHRAAVSLSVSIAREVTLIDQQLKTLCELKQDAIESLMKARDLIDEKLDALTDKEPDDLPDPDADPAAFELDFDFPARAEPASPDHKDTDPEAFEIDWDAIGGAGARG